MDGWRVDPDRVIGVLAGVDDEGAGLARAATDIDALAARGSAGLNPDGRTAVANAWQNFIDERRLVPGKLVHVLTSSARAVGEATVAVVAGDERMASDTRQVGQYALEQWGIETELAYMSGVY